MSVNATNGSFEPAISHQPDVFAELFKQAGKISRVFDQSSPYFSVINSNVDRLSNDEISRRLIQLRQNANINSTSFSTSFSRRAYGAPS